MPHTRRHYRYGIKDLDDAYAAATDELIAELDKATAE